MNHFFLSTISFLKRISFLYRLAGIFIAAVIIFTKVIPDIKFNMASNKSVEMTLEQLFKTPKENLPRYLKIKDAVVPSGSYVEFRKQKTQSLQEIYYPVYPSEEVKKPMSAINDKTLPKDSASYKVMIDTTGKLSLLKDTDKMKASLVIHDTHVSDSDLDSTGKYFNSPKFTIEGKFDDTHLGSDVLALFTEAGLYVDADAIVLHRGESGMSTPNAILLGVLGLFIGLLSVLTFVPQNNLLKYFGYQGTWEEYTAENAVSLEGKTPSHFGKRIGAYIIDLILLNLINFALPTSDYQFLISIAIAFLYFLGCDILLKGSSIGKLLLKLNVVSVNNSEGLSQNTVLLRNLVKAIFTYFPPIYFVALANPAKQTLHDMAAKTLVIDKADIKI